MVVTSLLYFKNDNANKGREVMSDKYALGVDIGGTKIAVALIDEQGSIYSRVERPTVTTSREDLFQLLIQCIDEVFEKSEFDAQTIEGIGIGVPGKVDVDKGIAVFQNNIPWENFPLAQRIKEVYGEHLLVKVDNDVKMAAYSEYKYRNLKSDELFTYVTISTGVAATSIENKQILRGSGFSGEIGFLPTMFENKIYGLEQIASGPGIEKRGKEILNDLDLTTKDIFKLYEKGHKEATEIVKEAAEHHAYALYTMVCVLDPKTFVLGGSVAYNNPKFVEEIRQALAEIVIPEQAHILDDIHISEYGSDNGIVGAGQIILD